MLSDYFCNIVRRDNVGLNEGGIVSTYSSGPSIGEFRVVRCTGCQETLPSQYLSYGVYSLVRRTDMMGSKTKNDNLRRYYKTKMLSFTSQ